MLIWITLSLSLYRTRINRCPPIRNSTFVIRNYMVGYNHFELRRYKRAYTDGPGGFVQGQLAPPMREAAIWVDEDVFRRD